MSDLSRSDLAADDIHIPAPGATRAPISASYRPRRVGMDLGGMRLGGIPLKLAAAGLGGVLLLGLGGWMVMGRRPAVVPVIEADSRPVRVKPDNPGGMQIADADDAVMGGTATGSDRMAPTAEVPAPQALRAQMQQPAAPAVVPVVVAVAPAAIVPPTPGASPLPDTPARIAAAIPKPAVAKPAPAPSGNTQVQLAALDSEAAAQAEWTRLNKRLPDLLASRHLVVQKADRAGQTIYRVRTGGFADVADATGFCGKLRAKGASCTVASF